MFYREKLRMWRNDCMFVANACCILTLLAKSFSVFVQFRAIYTGVGDRKQASIDVNAQYHLIRQLFLESQSLSSTKQWKIVMILPANAINSLVSFGQWSQKSRKHQKKPKKEREA